jgi:hypothetical protein
MRVIGQLLVLLTATILAFASCAYAQHFTRTLVFGGQSPRTYLDMILCALVGAAVASIIVSIPLAATFRRRAWLAAAAISLPVVALRLNEFITYKGSLALQVKVLALVEASSYLVILVLGSLCASLIRSRRELAPQVQRS